MENKGGNLARITAEAEAQLAAALAKQEADRRAASKVAHYYDGATEKAMWYNPGHRHKDRPHRLEAQSAVVSKLAAANPDGTENGTISREKQEQREDELIAKALTAKITAAVSQDAMRSPGTPGGSPSANVSLSAKLKAAIALNRRSPMSAQELTAKVTAAIVAHSDDAAPTPGSGENKSLKERILDQAIAGDVAIAHRGENGLCFVCNKSEDLLERCCQCPDKVVHEHCLSMWKRMMIGGHKKLRDEMVTCETCREKMSVQSTLTDNMVDTFHELDVDGNGSVTVEQLTTGLTKLKHMSPEDCKELFFICDKNQDEVVTMMEYLGGCKKYMAFKRKEKAKAETQENAILKRCGVASECMEFDELMGGGDPVFKCVAREASSGELSAYGGATFFEGTSGRSAQVVFTTKPLNAKREASTIQAAGTLTSEVKSVCIETGKVKVLRGDQYLAMGATTDADGAMFYACLQGQALGDDGDATAGLYSMDAEALFDDDEKKGGWKSVVTDWHGKRFNSPSDVVVRSSDGSFWFTDPTYGYQQGFRPEPMLGEWVWRHDPKKGVTRVVADGFVKPNALAFSPDETILYVTDTGYKTGDSIDPTAPRSIYAYDVIGSRVQNRRLLYVTPNGIPNGITCDKKGRIYTGCGDGVHVLSSEGELLGKILTSLTTSSGLSESRNSGVTNLCFGTGAHMSTLFMLTGDAVLSATLKM